MIHKFLSNLFKKNIKGIKEKYEWELFSKKGVVGIGTGKKVRNGRVTNENAIIVAVTEKKPLISLMEKDVIPKKLDGVKTDVLEVGVIEPLNEWRKKHRPIKLGASCSWEKLTACSFGLPLWDSDNNVYVMMNRHCANAVGSKVGEAIIQPSPYDEGKLTDKVGELTKYTYPVHSSNPNNIDVSLCTLTEEACFCDVENNSYIPEIRPLNDKDILKNITGGGRTLGAVRTGIIISIDFKAGVWWNEDGQKKVCYFPNCILTFNSDEDGQYIVMGGDSSSIRFIDNRPLAQTFAGSETVAIFNQTYNSIKWLEEEFGLKLYPKSPTEGGEEGYIVINREWLNEEKVLVNGLNFRTEPRIGVNVIRQINKGEKIKIIEYAGFNSGWHWVKIRALGYI